MFAKDVARHLGMSKSQLKSHNRSLLGTIWNDTKRIPKGFELRIPKSSLSDSAKTLIASIPSDKRFSEQTPDLFHIVVRGDTISEIAAQYGFKVREVMLANGMNSGHYIRVGQKLRLPVKDKAGVIALASAKKAIEEKQAASKQAPQTETDVAIKTDQQEQVILPPKAPVIEETQAEHVALINEEEKVSESDTDISVVAEPSHEVASNATLLTDPADYTVAENNSIEVQSSETLGHYAEWLDLRASRLREINRLRFGKPVVVGNRLELDFSRVSRDEFERRRIAYQKNLQEEFFTQYRIESTYQHKIKRGESLWVLALRKFKVPIWLLRQHNPDINFDLMRPGTVITVPNLIEVGADPNTVEKVG